MCNYIWQTTTYIYDDESSDGGRSISKNAASEALETMGATLNFIDCWLKLFHHNYEERYMMYHEATKICSKKYQQWNKNHLFTIKTPENIDRYWRSLTWSSQRRPFFYTPSHLSELKCFKSNIWTNISGIFIFKYRTAFSGIELCREQFPSTVEEKINLKFFRCGFFCLFQ